MFDAVTQLAFSAPPGGVHSVWIDGVQVVDDGHATLIDEEKLLADARPGRRGPDRADRPADPDAVAGAVT